MASASPSSDFTHTRLEQQRSSSIARDKFWLDNALEAMIQTHGNCPAVTSTLVNTTLSALGEKPREETDLEVTPVKMLTITNDFFQRESKHYVTIFVLCTLKDPDAQPKVMEANKCKGWEWKTWDDLNRLKDDPKEKLFLPMVNLLEQQNDMTKLTAID